MGFSFNPFDPGGLFDDPADQIFSGADAIADAIGDKIVEDIKSAGNALMDAAKSWSDTQFMQLNPVGYLGSEYVGGVVGDAWQFERNIVEGFADNIYAQHHGGWTGNWVEGRDATYEVLNSVVAAIAILYGGPYGWIAGTIMLDAQYNEGERLAMHIDHAARTEEITTGTSYIREYAAEIQMLITVVATMYAGSEAYGFFMDWTGLGAAISQWQGIVDVIGAVKGAYDIYSAYEMIMASQAYWEEHLRLAEEYYRKLLQQLMEAKEMWFEMMTDPEMIQRIMPGGDLFSMGAGHELMSVTSVAEPRFMLGLIDKSDPEMDRLNNNRYYAQYAGSDGFKIR